MKAIEYLILRFGLFLFYALVTSPVLFVLIWVVDFLNAHEQFTMLKWAIVPFVLAWLFGLPWLASQTAQRIAFEDQGFGTAVKLTFHDLQLYMAFLPLVGHWFMPRLDKAEGDGDDGEQVRSSEAPVRLSAQRGEVVQECSIVPEDSRPAPSLRHSARMSISLLKRFMKSRRLLDSPGASAVVRVQQRLRKVIWSALIVVLFISPGFSKASDHGPFLFWLFWISAPLTCLAFVSEIYRTWHIKRLFESHHAQTFDELLTKLEQ